MIQIRTCVNEHNVVVGFMDTNDERKAAILYSLDGNMVELNIPGSVSIATDINNAGDVIGFFLNDSGRRQAFVISPDGQLEFPNLLGWSSNTAHSIDSYGNVVGQFLSSGNSSGAYVWNSTVGSVDLNSLIDPHSLWNLQGATAISDSGYIVGHGINPHGEFQAFLLMPVPGPGTGIILGLLSMCGMTRSRLRQKSAL